MSDRAPAGGVFLYPKPDPIPGTVPVREYRRCRTCDRRFPVYRLLGRPPVRCWIHRRKRGRVGVFTP